MTTRNREVRFGQWLPDQPESANQGALIAKNVLPQIKGSYESLNSLSSFSSALADVCLASFWAQDENNVIFNFAADSDALYRLASGITWNDVSGPSAPYASTSWEFTKFGNRIIATSAEAPPQYWDLGVSTAFADLAGSPPQAKHIATVRDFVMMGNLAGPGSNYLQWSGYNNSEQWTPSLSTQSDTQPLFGRSGAIMRIVPGDYAQIFTEHSIWRGDYSGPPLIFQFDEVETKRGTPAPNSVVWSGGYTWFYGYDGFYRFDGRESTPISAERTSKWFEQNAASSEIASVRGAVDRRNRLILWAFKSSASEPINNMLIIYNWSTDRWSYAEIDTQIIDEYVSAGFSLDELDTPLPGGIDADSIPVDSAEYAGGVLSVQAFNASNEAATFSGSPLTATLDTQEIGTRNTQGHRNIVTNIRPLVEGSPSTVITGQVGKREKLQDNVNFTMAKGTNGINGLINVRQSARWQRYRLNISGGFTHGIGVNISEVARGGKR